MYSGNDPVPITVCTEKTLYHTDVDDETILLLGMQLYTQAFFWYLLSFTCYYIQPLGDVVKFSFHF